MWLGRISTKACLSSNRCPLTVAPAKMPLAKPCDLISSCCKLWLVQMIGVSTVGEVRGLSLATEERGKKVHLKHPAPIQVLSVGSVCFSPAA